MNEEEKNKNMIIYVLIGLIFILALIFIVLIVSSKKQDNSTMQGLAPLDKRAIDTAIDVDPEMQQKSNSAREKWETEVEKVDKEIQDMMMKLEANNN